MWWTYGLVYLSSTLVDCIPVLAPPAWTLMLMLMLKFDLNPYATVLIGTFGTVTGRTIFSTYIIPWLGHKTLNAGKESDLKFLGSRLSKRGFSAFTFVFVYALLPLPTTALFTAAGLARVKKIQVLPAFFLGNLIGDGILLISGKNTITSLTDLFKGSYSAKDIGFMILGLVLVLGLLVVDWRQLLQHQKFTLKWRFWKHARVRHS